MRMKCLRILPEMCARMICLFWSSTRNMAFGSVSMTTPSVSYMSCLGMRALLGEARPRPGGGGGPGAEDLRPVLGHGHGVLVVRGQAAVAGDGRPAVLEDLDLVAAGRD